MSEVLRAKALPPGSYDISRRQFLSDLVLEFLLKNFNGKILGITDKDLYAEPLNFVFGQAQLNGRAAIISIHRLDQKFYGKSPDKNLMV